MWPFVVLDVCVCASQRISLSALEGNPYKGPNSETSREAGSGRGKEGPREDRESLLTKRAEEYGRLERAVSGKDGHQKEAVRENSQR